ncbi:hypothetical protein [Pseudochryseolinea flava]|nr:hypothetical protein [Pseudochryseolinea flava]
MVQKKSLKMDQVGHGSHPQYTRALDDKITQVINDAGGDLDEAFENVRDLISQVKGTLTDEAIMGSKNVNEIVDF